jgi:hypothetical protein
MKQEPHLPPSTKEFVVGWQNIVEEHLAADLAAALHRLAASPEGGTEALARHVAHALQVAASPTGSVQAAVHYLCEVADLAEEARPQVDSPGKDTR